ncbi:hypothetical protein BDY21DRAFT_284931 [Lineolata rhizophorae]|uniref:C2H2-type domain-containing protein n=1 Tax=Lineolata rhizophorae TaxID=578093 RepID=A0A6A6P2Y2_9PEZI|nr:hypothetical protein BDY21DRAFT_284931 [Lineolata rhizophorae]
MDGRQTDYPQSGLKTPYPSTYPEPQSEGSPDQASAAQFQGQDPRSQNFSSNATPTSEYGLNPSSARSGSFPEYIQQQSRGYNQSSGQGANAGGMAQASSPSSMPPQDGQANHQNNASNIRSDTEVPIDPSITASPTYPPPGGQYSPYPAPQHDMSHYPGHPGTPIYATRGDWPGQYQTPTMPGYGHSPVTSGPTTPGLVSPVHRPPGGGHQLSTVYSFVPIPGAQQHKRPRRRYEEIERMYKCGWNGCEKAYGTLNHLNAHVTMQSHGQKRTPEEFKEIRKEWKQKKKEEEAARKAEEERHRQAEARNVAEGGSDPAYGQMRGPMGGPPNMPGGPQLPPIGYAPAASGQPQPTYGAPSPAMESMGQYNANNQMYSSNANTSANTSSTSSTFPQSPYAPGGQMYQQSPAPHLVYAI